MSHRATPILSRLEAVTQSRSENSAGLQEARDFPTSPGSTGGPVGLSGANTEAVADPSTRKPVREPRFVEGSARGGFGKIRSSKSDPCPVCGRASCSYSDDRTLLVCWRGNGGSDAAGWRYVGPGSSGGNVYARSDRPGGLRAILETVDAGSLTGSEVWARRADRYLEDPQADQRRRELAARLGVSPLALAGLSVGWKPGAYGVGAWTYPQRNSVGSVVSVGLRLDRDEDRQRYDSDNRRSDSDGGKTKSPPGLIYVPGRWLSSTGPVFSVEGMSDVAALDTIGLDAVGHPGNSPKRFLLDELEKLLRKVPEDRELVAVAERDPGREDDENAPGRRGARDKAQALANRLGRRVGVALPPDGAKDSRAWLQATLPAGGHPDHETRAALADRFVSEILAVVEWIEPEPEKPGPPTRVEKLQDDAVEIELDDYRDRMRQRLRDWVDQDKPRGRIGLLAAPAGSGKTTAVDELATPAYETVVSGIPTHANVAERKAALLRLPIVDPDDVAAFPKLDERSCISFTFEQADELRKQGHRGAVAASRLQALGFGVRATACRGCPLAPWKPTGTDAPRDADLDAFSPERVFADPAETVAEDGGDAAPRIRCAYWREVEEAKAARVKLATLDRVRLSSTSLVDKEKRSLVTIDERGFETYFPAVTVEVRELELLVDALEGAAHRMEAELVRPEPGSRKRRDRIDEIGLFEKEEDRKRRSRVRRDRAESDAKAEARSRRDADRIEHVRQLAAVAAELVERLHARRDSRTFGAVVVPIVRERKGRKCHIEMTDREIFPALVVRGRSVKQPAKLLADVLERSLPEDAVVPAAALELVRRAHARKLDRLVLHVEELDGGETSRRAVEDRRVRLSAVGTWETKLPPGADVLILDGTIDREAFAKRLGREVDEIAPPAKIRRRSLAVQLPKDITAETSPVVVAQALEQALAALPDCRRVGVILLRKHREKLFPVDRHGNDRRTDWSKEHVPEDVLARIARDADGRLLVEHYAGGRDRSSNAWIEQADGLVLLGTRRPPSVSVVQELARRQEDEALAAGSAWGRIEWEARTRDGRVVRCHGRGYVQPAWAAAARAVTLAGLLQALERARTVLPTQADPDGRPGGIPVVVVSSEPGLGLPVVDALPDPVSKGARRVAAVVRTLVGSGTNLVPPCEDREACDPVEGGSISATTPIGHTMSSIERVALIGTVPVGRVVAALESGDGGPPVPLRTVRRWTAEALVAGLIVRSGSTRATVYGLPDTGTAPPIPDMEPEPLVVETDEDLEVWVDRPSTLAGHAKPHRVEPWKPEPPEPPDSPPPRYWDAAARGFEQAIGRAHRVERSAVHSAGPPRVAPPIELP